MIDVIGKTSALARALEGAGMTISGADRFVIGAAQTLIASSAELLSFEDIRDRLEALRLRLGQSGKPEEGSTPPLAWEPVCSTSGNGS